MWVCALCGTGSGERGSQAERRPGVQGLQRRGSGGKWRAVSSGRPPALRGAYISGARASCQLWEEAVMQWEVREDSLAGEVVPDL